MRFMKRFRTNLFDVLLQGEGVVSWTLDSRLRGNDEKKKRGNEDGRLDVLLQRGEGEVVSWTLDSRLRGNDEKKKRGNDEKKKRGNEDGRRGGFPVERRGSYDKVRLPVGAGIAAAP